MEINSIMLVQSKSMHQKFVRRNLCGESLNGALTNTRTTLEPSMRSAFWGPLLLPVLTTS